MRKTESPEIHISALRVILIGPEAIRRAGWALRFLLICRGIGALTVPWISYVMLRLWVG